MNQSRYVIRGGKAGRERLRLLARIMEPGTTELFGRVGIQPGWSCLDIGCGGGDVTRALAERVGPSGRVLGVDVDQTVVDIAQQEAERSGLTNISFQCAAADTFRIDSSFDLIYCRFLLTHLPNPAGVLDNIMYSLKPGGALVVEDIDFSGHFCSPHSAPFQRYIELYYDIVRRQGGDPDIGLRIPSLLLGANCLDVQVHVEQPAAISGETKLMAAVTWENIADQLLIDGLSTAAEIESVAEALYTSAHDSCTLMSLPRIIQAWGYRAVNANTALFRKT